MMPHASHATRNRLARPYAGGRAYGSSYGRNASNGSDRLRLGRTTSNAPRKRTPEAPDPLERLDERERRILLDLAAQGLVVLPTEVPPRDFAPVPLAPGATSASETLLRDRE